MTRKMKVDVMTRKMKVNGDDEGDEGGRDEVLEFRSRLECGFM